MSQHYTIRCPVSVRDDFDDYVNQFAAPADRQRAIDAFDTFHELFAVEPGIRPGIRYEASPQSRRNAVDMELIIHGVRFFFEIDFAGRDVQLNGISVK